MRSTDFHVYLLNRIWIKLWHVWEKIVLWKGYNPRSYWRERGRYFHLETQQNTLSWQHESLRNVLSTVNWNSILEVGCGFGRNIEFILQHFPSKRIVGVDFSPTMLSQCKKRIKNENVQLLEMSALELSLRLPCFDAVLIHGLLMHISPHDVTKAVEEIVKVSKKHIFVIEEIVGPGSGVSSPSQNINAFTFHHPYIDLFLKKNCKLVNEKIVDKLAFFYFIKE